MCTYTIKEIEKAMKKRGWFFDWVASERNCLVFLSSVADKKYFCNWGEVRRFCEGVA